MAFEFPRQEGNPPAKFHVLILLFRYSLQLVGLNGLASESDLAVDDVSLSPQCFGLGVPQDVVGGWRFNMTDVEFCHYFGEGKLLKLYMCLSFRISGNKIPCFPFLLQENLPYEFRKAYSLFVLSQHPATFIVQLASPLMLSVPLSDTGRESYQSFFLIKNFFVPSRALNLARPQGWRISMTEIHPFWHKGKAPPRLGNFLSLKTRMLLFIPLLLSATARSSFLTILLHFGPTSPFYFRSNPSFTFRSEPLRRGDEAR